MAADIFAKIGDIKGESLDAKHKDEIEVLSWSWGVTQSRHRWPHGGGGGEGKASFHDLQLHALRRQGVAGADAGVRHRRAHQGSDDHARKAGKGQQEFLIIKMNDVIITSVTRAVAVATAATGERQPPFAKVDLEYKPQKADGSLDAGIHFKYHLKEQKLG